MTRHGSDRLTAGLIVWTLVAVGSPNVWAQPAKAPESHQDRVRTLDPLLRFAFDEGMRRSPRFAALVGHLQQSDLIVYLTQGSCPSRRAIGCVVAVNQQGTSRYVRVNLVLFRQAEATDLRRSRILLVAQIGHELQHAIEIADDPSVVDSHSLERALIRMRAQRTWFGYETDAAIRVGNHVLTEMARHGAAGADSTRAAERRTR